MDCFIRLFLLFLYRNKRRIKSRKKRYLLELSLIKMNYNIELIKKYFPNLNQLQVEQFAKLGELYTFWNAQINVISRKDMENFYLHHVLHSLGIAKFAQNFKPGTKILDVGTGGGFPGIPLAILFPEVTFHLVDSIGKKIKVVNEVAQSLGLKNRSEE